MSDALEDVAAPFKAMPWVQFLGIEMTQSDPGEVTLRIDPKPEHHNQNGTVNAPVMFGLAEAAGAAAIVMGFLDLLGQTYSVVRHVEMSFLAAARGPVNATGTLDPTEVERARAEVEQGRPVDLPVPVVVRDDDGREVARIEMIMSIRAQRAPEPDR
jgi:acyl-coenzyme A thioesterase PaaI-like protein